MRRCTLRLLMVALLGSTVWAGCAEPDAVVRYQVPKPDAINERHGVSGPTTARPPSAAGTMGRGAPSLQDSPSLQYDVPDGWQAGPAAGMRKAAFGVRDGDKSATITVIDLPQSGGNLLANVNRWQGQIEQSGLSDSQLQDLVEEIEMDGLAGHYVELFGPEDAQPRKSIFGVILPREGRTWFFKLMGDHSLVEREKARFEVFLRSVRFEAEGAGTDGQ